ncbi:MAG: hypothetical protein GXP47_00025 [Acidobacteria bacterium]|nr:hypothetical protein [Acidobacteriota bacterium]
MRTTPSTLGLAVAALLFLTFIQAPPSWAASSKQELKIQQKQERIDLMARETMQRLFKAKPQAKELYDTAYGYAVFDNLKLAFGFSGGGGNGVAIDTKTGKKTYMKMGTAGVGLGLGGQKYQVVFLFQNKAAFDNFVNKGWSADAGAKAAAGKSGVNAKTGFTNGIAIYQFTDKGLMAAADIAGTKYWKNDKLND